MDTSDFIIAARKVHGDRYDYHNSVYHHRKPIVITCKIHGDFMQRYDHHIGPRAGGCRQCYFESLRGNRDTFVEKAKSVHGGKYSYESAKYSGYKIKTAITCAKHGLFEMSPANHIAGSGCPSCAKEEKLLGLDGFIENAKKKHGNRYIYSISEYNGSDKWLKIICPDHGVFEKTPENHCHSTNPQGCPKCVEYSGFNYNKKGYVYVLRSNDGALMKIGISNFPKKRHKVLSKATPFEFKCIAIKEFKQGIDARNSERAIHSKFSRAGMSGFDGCTEWFFWDDAVMDFLV